MVSKGKIGIVIVNYNGKSYQNDCIGTIKKQTYKNYEVVVVDSNSKDDSLELLENEYPGFVKIIRCNDNVGVAKGNNIGIRCAKDDGCEYILLLNNDTELAENMLELLICKASENTVTVPKMYYYDSPDIVWLAGGEMKWNIGEAIHIGIKEKDVGQYDEEKSITYAPTTAMLIHRDIFDAIGEEDETYFMYWDDTDICARLIMAGFTIKYLPGAKLWHKVSSSSGGEKSPLSVYYQSRNQLYFLNKFRVNITIKTLIFVFLKGICKWILSPVRRKSDGYILKGWFDYWNGKMGKVEYWG